MCAAAMNPNSLFQRSNRKQVGGRGWKGGGGGGGGMQGVGTSRARVEGASLTRTRSLSTPCTVRLACAQPTNPHARKLDVEADMKPVVAFLTEEAALSQAQAAKVGVEVRAAPKVVGAHVPAPPPPPPLAQLGPSCLLPWLQVILAYPAVLCFSVDDRLRPFFSYLTAPEPLGLSPGEAAQVLERRPTVRWMGGARGGRVGERAVRQPAAATRSCA